MSTADQAFALLDAHRRGEITLTRKAGSFCGQTAVAPEPFTEKQAEWFATLLRRAGLDDDKEHGNG
jgi:hypothetical protein